MCNVVLRVRLLVHTLLGVCPSQVHTPRSLCRGRDGQGGRLLLSELVGGSPSCWTREHSQGAQMGVVRRCP